MTKHIDVKVERDKGIAESNSERNVHDHLKHLSLIELQEVSQSDRLPWHTMCLNLTGDLNIGTIVRTSHLLGASSVILVGRAKYDKRGAVGSMKYIKIERINTMLNDFEINVDKVKDVFLERKLIPIFCELGGQLLNKVDWQFEINDIINRGFAPCLVMGNESGGIPDNILSLKNDFEGSFGVSIPQRGVIRSFNVSVAHSIISGHMLEDMNWL